jgi:ATP-dependent protease HslVU (ClpYQ) ATPase subunit
LQGRLPIRVELKALSRDDFRRILTEPEHSLLKQASALMATEGVELAFDDGSVDALADLAAEINATGGEHRRAAAVHRAGAAPGGGELLRQRPAR